MSDCNPFPDAAFPAPLSATGGGANRLRALGTAALLLTTVGCGSEAKNEAAATWLKSTEPEVREIADQLDAIGTEAEQLQTRVTQLRERIESLQKQGD